MIYKNIILAKSNMLWDLDIKKMVDQFNSEILDSFKQNWTHY